MKKLKYLLILLAGLTCWACEENEDNPAFAPDEVYVYDSSSMALTTAAGKEFRKDDLVVSPNDGSVECRWLVIDPATEQATEISQTKDLVYTFPTAGAYTLRFEATRGGRTVSKSYALTVN